MDRIISIPFMTVCLNKIYALNKTKLIHPNDCALEAQSMRAVVYNVFIAIYHKTLLFIS